MNPRITLRRAGRLLPAIGFLALCACHKSPAADAAAAGSAKPAPGSATVLDSAPPGATRVPVAVSEVYAPDKIPAKAGQPLVLVFTRTTDDTCGTAVVFPDLHVSKPLPLSQPVEVAIQPTAAGAIDFTCGMQMMHGEIDVQQ
jgi:hypothetical protein